jgi:hypothetical protein
MAEEKESPAFMSALVTEHFALQSVATSTISENGNRAAIYLSALSSGLVAIGFASSSPRTLAALAFSIFPTVFILGYFTIVRLIDTSVQNIVALRRIEVIRRYYASLLPTAPEFFEPDRTAEGARGLRYGGGSILFTMASMVIVVNSVYWQSGRIHASQARRHELLQRAILSRERCAPLETPANGGEDPSGLNL